MMRASNVLRSGVKNVTVIGGGLMGGGIAQVSAAAGLRVQLVDRDDSALEHSKAAISKTLARLAKKQAPEDPEAMVQKILSGIQFTTDAEAAVKDADLVVEAIVENLGIKQELFKRLDGAAPEKTIFASNTSSLSIEEICNGVRPERFGGLHFFSPVPLMKLVEVVQAPHTSDATTKSLTDFGTAVGKTPILCKDTSGFVVNRLLCPFLSEAIRLVERGDATMEAVDTGMKLGAGHPMGPFALADAVGLDTLSFILEGWEKRFPEEQSFRQPAMLKELVAKGHFGVKTGRGFYDYSTKK